LNSVFDLKTKGKIMALVLEANYSKKLGLPGYSSHQYSVTVRTELSDMAQVETESTKLYHLLQSSVDREIQKSGFLPANPKATGNGNGHGPNFEPWNCSSKQRELIQRIVAEHNLDKNSIEQLALERFGKSLKALDKLEASGLIDELLERHGNKNAGRAGHQLQRTGSR
jgi:hypothetical protein